MCKKNTVNKENIVVFTCVFICMLFVTLLLQISTDDIFACTQIEKYSDKMQLSNCVDVTMDAGLCNFSGKNPCVEYGLNDDFYYVNVLIQFAAPLEHSEKIILDYAGDDGEYTYWGGDSLYLNKGADYVIAPISTAWDIKTIKISIEPSLYDYPAIESVSLQRTGKMSKLSLVLAWLLKDYIFLRNFVLSFFMALALTLFFEYADKNDVANKKKSYLANICAVVVIITSVLAVYQNYIWGNRLFIFNDCAGDSAGLFYPSQLDWARLAERGIAYGISDYTKGLGANGTVPVTQFTSFSSLFGTENVANMMLLYQMTMAIMSGICIFFTGVLYSNSRKTALIAAISYVFCSEFTIRAAWPSYSYTMMFLALWLLAFELYYRKDIWYILPLPTMLILAYTDTFYQLFWTVILSGYIIIRYMMYDGRDRLKRCIFIEVVYVLLILVFQNGLIDNIIYNIQGDRFKSGIEKFIGYTEQSNNIKAGFDSIITSADKLFPGFLRTIGQNIGGITINYRGGNYLLDLTLYCGVLTCILLPVALYNMPVKRRRSYGILVVAALAYIFIYPVTMIMTAFTGLYKLSSQWIIISIILIAMELMNCIMKGENLRKGSLIVMSLTDIAVFVVAFFSVKKGYVLSKKLLVLSLFFVLLYSVIICIYDKYKASRAIIGRCIVVLLIVEVLSISWNSFNDRITFTKDYNPYFDDGTITALKQIETVDNTFYRIEKQKTTVEDNDSLAQDYFGTRLYLGGGDNLTGEGVYRLLALPFQEGYRLKGTASDLYAMTILGVKYYLSADNLLDKYGYSLIDRIDGISVYKSDYAMPVVYATDKIFAESELIKLDAYSRKRNMIGGVVVSDNAELNIDKTTPREYKLGEIEVKEITAKKIEDSYFLNIDNGQVLLVYFELPEKINNAEYIYRTSTGQEEVIYFGTDVGQNILEICVDNIESIGFKGIQDNFISNVKFYVADRDEYYSEYVEQTDYVSRFDTIEYDRVSGAIDGTIDVSRDSVLVTQYYTCDIIVDGEKQETFPVNDNFVGCNIKSGAHNVAIYVEYEDWYKATVTEAYISLFKNIWFKAIIIMILGGALTFTSHRCRKVIKK